jgi:hypothetical protein
MARISVRSVRSGVGTLWLKYGRLPDTRALEPPQAFAISAPTRGAEIARRQVEYRRVFIRR